MLVTAKAYGLDFLVPEGDRAVGAALRDHGEFARPEVDLICAYLATAGRPSTYVDVGANVGAIALPVAAANPDCRVVAYEASRSLSGVLAANALNNGLLNVAVTHAAAVAEPGLLQFPDVPLSALGNFGAIGFDHAEAFPPHWVRGCALDSEPLTDVGFVKIDVEGHDLGVLQGAERLLAARTTPWLVEVNADRTRSDAVFSFLKSRGYGLFWFFAPFVTPSAKDGAKAKVSKGDFNWLALPPGVANIWDLPEHASLEAEKPKVVQTLGYLARYGYRPYTG